MILIFRLNLEIIKDLGKKYLWNKPNMCPSCRGNRLWGHGFVLRYFQGFHLGLWMKKWRCPDCGAVHTGRPYDYPPGFQHSENTIYNAIRNKLSQKSYLKEISYQTQQYWHKALSFQSRLNNNWIDIEKFFTQYIMNGQLMITFRLKYRVIPCSSDPPHLLFAVKVR